MSYLDQVVGTLLDTSPFYSPFIAITKFEMQTQHLAAIGWNGHNLVVYIKPQEFETYHMSIGRGILKHEYAHYMLRHLLGSRRLKLETLAAILYPNNLSAIKTIVNIVEDIEINGAVVPLNELPDWVQHAGLYNLEQGLLAEEYLRLIHQDKMLASVFEHNQDVIYIENMDDIDDELLKERIKAAQSRGDMPAGLGRILDLLNPPSIGWKNLFRFETLSVLRSRINIPTFSKLNRRNSYSPGSIYRDLPIVYVFQDTSGSISDANLAILSSEIYGLRRYVKYIEILVCDADVHSTYRFKNKIQSLKGGGGSNFVPAFDQVFETKHRRPPVIILLTDGDILVPTTLPKCSVFWVLCNGDKTVPYGKKIIIG